MSHGDTFPFGTGTCMAIPSHKNNVSYDVASGIEIPPSNKIDKPMVVYRFTGKGMTSITTLRI